MEKGLEIFAKRLQQARIKAKLSMEKLSTLMSEKADVKVTKQAISKYEKALMMPSSTVQIAMAEILKQTLLWVTSEPLKSKFKTKLNAISRLKIF